MKKKDVWYVAVLQKDGSREYTIDEDFDVCKRVRINAITKGLRMSALGWKPSR